MVKVAHTGPYLSQRRLLAVFLALLILGYLISVYENKRMNTEKVYRGLQQFAPLTVGEIAGLTGLTKEQVRSALLNLQRNGGHAVRLDDSIKFSEHRSRDGEKQKWRLNERRYRKW